MKEEDFKQFIERVEQLKNDKSDDFTQQELEDIASELGLTSDDLKAASKRATDCKTRAQEFIDRKLPDEALRELKDSIALAPWESESFFLQALAYEIKWNNGDEDSLKSSMTLCRKCIERNSSFEPGFDLMARLKKPAPVKSASKANKHLTFFLVCVAGVVSYNFQQSGPSSSPPATVPTKTIEVQPVQVESQPVTIPTPTTYVRPHNEVAPPITDGSTLPMKLVHVPKSEGINLFAYSSSPKYGHHTMKVTLKNSGSYEYSKFKVRVDYLDKDGKVIFNTRELGLLGTYQSVIRPGNFFSYNGTFSLKTLSVPPASANLVVTEVERLQAPPSYGKIPVAEFEWKTEKPHHLNILCLLRSKRLSESFLHKGKQQSIITVVFENTGSGAFRRLSYAVRYKGTTAEQVFTSKKKLLITSSKQPLRPGENRPTKIYDSLPFKPEHFIIQIIEAQ